jgi:GNAT superfamily N-acetyltransferase
VTPGPRTHKQASLRVAIATGLPEDMRSGIREIIDLESKNQGKGHATALMHRVCEEADRTGHILLLMPKAFSEGMTTEQLMGWYGRFGFIAVQQEPVLLVRQVTGCRTH